MTTICMYRRSNDSTGGGFITYCGIDNYVQRVQPGWEKKEPCFGDSLDLLRVYYVQHAAAKKKRVDVPRRYGIAKRCLGT